MEQSVPKRRHIKFRRRDSLKRKNTIHVNTNVLQCTTRLANILFSKSKCNILNEKYNIAVNKRDYKILIHIMNLKGVAQRV